MKEHLIETRLTRRVSEAGGLAWKWTSPSKRGVPDRIVVLNGNVVFVECKSSTGKLSNIQKHVIAKMRDAGADVEVINSYEQIDELVERLSTK